MLAAFLRDSLDRRLKDQHDIEHLLQVPIVGYVEADALGGAGVSNNGSMKAPHAGLEPFRILRSNVEFLAPDRPLRTVAVTSPVAEEGKSTVAAGFATASALAGKRVLLVECDLRRPVFAERLRLAPRPGLTDWLAGSAEPSNIVQATPVDPAGGRSGEAAEVGGAAHEGTLVTMVAGSWSSQPAELLASSRFKVMLEQVSDVYDLVVLDCAPLLPVGDSLEVLPLVDAALICIRLDQTTRELARAAKAALEHLPPRPTGVVITGIRPGREGYYYGYYSSAAATQQRSGSVAARG
jgi:Mrp family chromosome partitioning ATPase